MKPNIPTRTDLHAWLATVMLLWTSAGMMHAQVTLHIGNTAKGDGGGVYRALTAADKPGGKSGPQDVRLDCGPYRIYGYAKVEPQRTGLSFEKVSDGSQVPVGIRLLLDSTTPEYHWYMAELPADLCGMTVKLPGSATWFSHRLGAEPGAVATPCTTGTGTCCEPGCGPCDGHARYRITYDVAADRLCVMKKVRRAGEEEWRTLTGKRPILRPNVHRFIEVRMVNFNDLVGAPKLEYRFENLHQEYGDLFATAFMKVPSTPTPAPDVPDEAPQDSAATGPGVDSLMATTSAPPCKFMTDLKEAGTGIAALLKRTEVGSVSEVGRTFRESLSAECNADMDPAGIVAGKVDLMKRCEDLSDQGSLCTATELEAVKDSLVKAYYRAGAHAIKELQEGFAKRLKEAKALPLTPDKEAIKVELDKAIVEAFTAAWWSLLEGVALQTKLEGIVTKAAHLKVLPADTKEDELLKVVKEVQQLYHDLTTYTNYALAPIQMKDMDMLHLQFKLGDNKLNDMPYEFHLAGGWKVDFSAGIAITGLQDHKYFYDDQRQETAEVVGDSVPEVKNFATIRESVRSPFDWSAAVMAHGYARTAIVPSFGITTGVLLRPESVRWLGGASVMLGHRNRFVLSGGVAIGAARRLADGQELGEEVSLSTDMLNSTPPTETFTDMSWFFAFSYNIAGIQLNR